MNWSEFIFATLAVWLFTHLIASEDGAFKFIAWIREKAGQGVWGTLLDCFYCLSVWVAIPFAIAVGSSAWQKFLLWPALSAGAIVLNRSIDSLAPDPPIYREEMQLESPLGPTQYRRAPLCGTF